MENDLISRRALKKTLLEKCFYPAIVNHVLKNAPAVNAVELSADFGCILNCAVRYAIGRRTYIPSLVIGFITPLIPRLDNRTLWCFDQDITDVKWDCGYGDPNIDEPGWMKFREAVRAERIKRGETPYKSWREIND